MTDDEMLHLYDYATGDQIGPASPEQVIHSYSDERDYLSGVIAIDCDGQVRHPSSDPAVYGALRSVYVA